LGVGELDYRIAQEDMRSSLSNLNFFTIDTIPARPGAVARLRLLQNTTIALVLTLLLFLNVLFPKTGVL